jgi:predicted protein tyrosine phosphatase
MPRKTATERGSRRRPTRSVKATHQRPQPAIDVLVLSASAALVYEPSGREVCISVTNPGSRSARLSSRFVDVLRVSFSDIAAPSPFAFDKLFAPEHATAIVEFVNRWADADRIVVHCLGGVSRSPAIALGIAELRGWPTDVLERQFPMWNTYVREQLVKVGRVHDRPRRARREGSS